MLRYKAARNVWRRLAWPVAFCYVGSIITPAFAAVPRPFAEGQRSKTRHLTPSEMTHIFGGQSHTISLSAASGDTYPWEGSVSHTNTGNGNKLTEIPIVGWTAKGGMPVSLSLFHNSQGNHNSELGQKWTHSYDIYVSRYNSMNVDGDPYYDITVHWGNDLAYTFIENIDHTYTAPTGIYDGLVRNTSGGVITSYDLTTKGQVKHHFTNPNGTGWYISTITDRNSNAITVNHNSSDLVTTIVDPNSRTLTLSYTSGKITGISDPLSRSWSLSYTSSDLTQVTWPSVGGNSYNEQFAYDAGSHHDIVTHTDKRGHSDWTATYNSSEDSLATLTDACSNTTSFSYASGATTITDANSHSLVHNYTNGRLSSVTDQLSNSESYSYDSSNNRTGMTDRRGHSWSWTFDSSGNVLTATDPLSHATTWTFNSKNRPLTLVDADSHQVVNTYDATLSWNLTQTQEKTSGGTVLSTTSYSYNSDGTVHTKTDSNSHVTTYGYGTNGDLTSVTTPNSRVTSWTVNSLGVRTSRTDALNNTTNYTLDNWNRVTTVDYPTGTDPTFSYDLPTPTSPAGPTRREPGRGSMTTPTASPAKAWEGPPGAATAMTPPGRKAFSPR